MYFRFGLVASVIVQSKTYATASVLLKPRGLNILQFGSSSILKDQNLLLIIVIIVSAVSKLFTCTYFATCILATP